MGILKGFIANEKEVIAVAQPFILTDKQIFIGSPFEKMEPKQRLDELWNKAKSVIEKRQAPAKQEDEIWYIVMKINKPGHILILAEGKGKKGTLENIYLKNKDVAAKGATNTASEETVAKVEPEKKETAPAINTENKITINIADETIDIASRINAVNEHRATGKFNEDDSFEYLRDAIGLDNIQKVKTTRNYFRNFLNDVAIAVKNKKKELQLYTTIDPKLAAEYLQSINKDFRNNIDIIDEYVVERPENE